MASNIRLARAVGSQPSILFSRPSSLNPTALLVQRAFSGTAARNIEGGNGSSNKPDRNIKNTTAPAADASKLESTSNTNTSVSRIAAEEEGAKKKVVEEAERKRIEAQDAALKEILDSAAAEKKKLEEEALRRAEEERARWAAKEAAEAEAKRKAEAEAKRKAEAEAAAAALEQSKASQASKPNVSEHKDATKSLDSANKALNTGSVSDKPLKSAVQDSGIDTGAAKSLAAADPKVLSDNEWASKATGEQASSMTLSDTDPLEQFRARLLPYKRSLESSTEYIRSVLPDNLRQLSESVKRKDYRDTVAQLSEHLNNFTGYTTINELKQKVITHGDRLDNARIKLIQSKQAYEDAVGTRSDTQKAINDLLQRKHLWSPDDVIRFTDLYRSEHANEQAEQRSKIEYRHAEEGVEEKSRMLTRVIMERYHEEQVWSDKIRAASTYGTWGLIGVNVMAFLIVQAFVEPRRRRKQVERYEELVQDLTERGVLPEKIAGTVLPASAAAATASAPAVSMMDDTKAREEAHAKPVSIGAALLGGEELLSKVIQSAERQEERLCRIENAVLQRPPGAVKVASLDETSKEQEIDYVVAEDGTILFVPEEEIANAVDLGEGWAANLEGTRGSRSQGWSERTHANSMSEAHTENRLSRIIRDGEEKVVATRTDFLVSTIGGAIVGGLIAAAVMLNR